MRYDQKTMTLAAAKELERLKGKENSSARSGEFDLKQREIDRTISRRSGAWHEARTNLAFSRIEVEINDRLSIRRAIIERCPELAAPLEMAQFEQTISSFIENSFEAARRSFASTGVRPPVSVLSELPTRKLALQQKVRVAARTMQLEVPPQSSSVPPKPRGEPPPAELRGVPGEALRSPMPLNDNEQLTLEVAHVLFMDIVGYSKLSVDEQLRQVRRLQNIVSNTAEFGRAKANNQLISVPTGDGMALAFFGDAEAATRCVFELWGALQQTREIKLRMGLHTGPVYRTADINANMNVSGGGINVAQRVMDCGDAGHILVSNSMADILGQLSTWSDCLHDLGEAEVKHGLRIHLFNMYRGRVGNPEVPAKMCSAQIGERLDSPGQTGSTSPGPSPRKAEALRRKRSRGGPLTTDLFVRTRRPSDSVPIRSETHFWISLYPCGFPTTQMDVRTRDELAEAIGQAFRGDKILSECQGKSFDVDVTPDGGREFCLQVVAHGQERRWLFRPDGEIGFVTQSAWPTSHDEKPLWSVYDVARDLCSFLNLASIFWSAHGYAGNADLLAELLLGDASLAIESHGYPAIFYQSTTGVPEVLMVDKGAILPCRKPRAYVCVEEEFPSAPPGAVQEISARVLADILNGLGYEFDLNRLRATLEGICGTKSFP